MRNEKIATVLLVGSVFVFQGCAHGGLDKRLDAKLSGENTVKARADLQAEAGQLIEAAPGLSADQRSNLTALRETVRTQTDAIRERSLKLRSVLIKDLMSASYDEDEVELVKERIKNLEDQRLSALFNAVERANAILGRQASANQQIVHDFFEHAGHSN
ncbi:MAG: hypothetical protein HY074_08385 [Deltaproteobacteria bacterium]|nr:hypothetical protein [Deltaproteobacteria bacterium]